MTLGEKLLGASAVQTDASGLGSLASGNSNHRLSALQIGTVCMDPAFILPLELLEIIFQLALPSIDIMAPSWDNEACRAHMAALYVLRRVSTTWKGVVDHTPSLWAVISSAFPKDVNSTSLVRSGSVPLVICFPGAYWGTTPPFREFLPTIEPHLQRCSSLALRLGSELVDEVPSLSLQRLVALKIRIDVEPSWQPSDVIPFTSNIEISDEVLENIRDIDLTRVPMDWAKTLEHLVGLRTLSLDGIYDDAITQEQILGVLAASPGLETLILIDIEIEDPLSSSPPSAKSISLPHLQSITLIADGLFINGVSAAQTDVCGGQSTSPPAPEISNHPPPAVQTGTVRLDPISILPFEVLEVIFQLVLPPLDIVTWPRGLQEYHPDTASLYILRRVSTAWKDMIDSTPSLWAVISSTFPEDVNRSSLVRSGSSPLLIYVSGTSWIKDQFFQMIEPHIQRCSSLVLRLDADYVHWVPRLALLRLATLKIVIELKAPPTHVIKKIEIPEEALENVLTQAPMDWARTLRHLKDLRILQILNSLAASPGIEILTFAEMNIELPPLTLPSSTEPISLPRLRSITLAVDIRFTNGFLRGVRPPPSLTDLGICPNRFYSQDHSKFWQETMAPWEAVVHRLYRSCNERVVCLIPGLPYSLKAHSKHPKHPTFMVFEGTFMPAALQWIHNLFSTVTDVAGRPGLRVRVWHSALSENDVLATLQTMQGLKHISVESPDGPSAEAFINVLGKPTADSIGTPDPRPTFPTLQKLELSYWTRGLDNILDGVQRRYMMRSCGGHQVPDLTMDLSPLRLWERPRSGKTIMSFPNAQALRKVDGVKELRIGRELHPSGSLAVIWDEEESVPVWG
ncbi:hypothetical protein FRC01_004134 [Tulasnella sp. 417]|nr:hypothetical protein FRC01_004134 [Tulasnella sp. 417]